MRFRRRSNAPPEPEADDESVWARPEGGEAVDEAGEEAGAEPAPPGESVPRADEQPADELPAESADEVEEPPAYEVEEPPAYEPPQKPAYEVEEPPAYEPLAVETPPPASTPAPVTSWSGGPGDMAPAAEGTLRAAGGVVWSRWQGGLRVVLVHRPRYDDWSLPKGKAGPGESDADCALREVREETGLACSLGEDLGTTSYHDRHGRLKTVRYFAMQPLGGGESPQHEVDEVRWLGLEEARRLLSYDRDVGMLDALAEMAAGGAHPEREFEPPPGD